jgi:hypothetical protein
MLITSTTTGASIKELMRRAGHASAAAALRYQHATEDRDKAIANAFDEMLRGDVVPITKPNRLLARSCGFGVGVVSRR